MQHLVCMMLTETYINNEWLYLITLLSLEAYDVVWLGRVGFIIGTARLAH